MPAAPWIARVERSESSIPNAERFSIEPTGERSFMHGFHLGTDKAVATQIAEEMFAARNRAGMPTTTVALLRDHRLAAVYDGEWR